MTYEKGPKILCPFCNAVQGSEIEAAYSYSMGSELTGVYDEKTRVVIRCQKCEKVIYDKNHHD